MLSSTADLARRLVLAGSPFELTAERTFRRAPRCLGEIYRKAAASATHICLQVDGRDVSYGLLLKEAATLARFLVNSTAITAGSRVAILLPSGPQWFAAFIAVTSTEGCAVLVDVDVPVDALMSALETTQSQVLIVDETMKQVLVDAGIRGYEMIVARSSEHSYFDGVSQAADSFSFDAVVVNPEQDAIVSFTSGSMSSPKGVICSHRAIIAGLMNMSLGSALAAVRAGPKRVVPDPRRRPVSLLLSPFAHVGGYMHLLLMMQVAGKVVPARGADAKELTHLIGKHSVTALSGIGARSFSEMLREGVASGNLSTLARIGLHGEALRSEFIEDIRALLPGVEISTGYGLTETNGSISLASSADFVDRPGTSGLVVPSVEVRVVDENDRELPAGETGDVELRGAMLMSNYCGSPEANAHAFRNGWFRTGDLGFVDKDGFLTIGERRSHLIRIAGKMFSGSQIERLAIGSGVVADAAALQFSSTPGAEQLLLAVVPASGHIEIEASLVRSLNDELGLEPGRVRVMPLEHLPRLASGKLDRRSLQARCTGQ